MHKYINTLIELGIYVVCISQVEQNKLKLKQKLEDELQRQEDRLNASNLQPNPCDVPPVHVQAEQEKLDLKQNKGFEDELQRQEGRLHASNLPPKPCYAPPVHVNQCHVPPVHVELQRQEDQLLASNLQPNPCDVPPVHVDQRINARYVPAPPPVHADQRINAPYVPAPPTTRHDPYSHQNHAPMMNNQHPEFAYKQVPGTSLFAQVPVHGQHAIVCDSNHTNNELAMLQLQAVHQNADRQQEAQRRNVLYENILLLGNNGKR